MNITSMTYVLCVHIRDQLLLTAEEAALHIGEDVSVREWLHWESNREPVPEYVVKRINDINLKYKSLIKMLAEDEDHSAYVITNYNTYEEYKADHPDETFIDWVIVKQASLIASTAGEHERLHNQR